MTSDPLDRVIAALAVLEALSNSIGEVDRGLRRFGGSKKRDRPHELQSGLQGTDHSNRSSGTTRHLANRKNGRNQQLCWLAGLSAETLHVRRQNAAWKEEWAKYDLDCYKQLRAECIELADTINGRILSSSSNQLLG